MKESVLSYDGGVNSKADPSVLKPDVLTDAVNYENKDAGKITKRVETAEFNSGMDTIIASTFDEVIYIPEEPFYPSRVLEDMAEDVMYPVFGRNADGSYLLYLFYYDTSDTWVASKVDISGIVYTVNSSLRINYDQGIMYIADWGSQNKTHRVYIDAEYNLVETINEIPRPLNKPQSVGLSTFNLSVFQENLETGAYVNYCGVYRYWTTFITEDDDESNPSPASDWFDLQFFKKDEDDLDMRMVRAVTMSNLGITSNASDIEEQIKWFGIYREELQFVEGVEIRIAKFIKKISSSDTEFTDTIAILSGDVVPDINYENDSSPIGRDIFSVGGALILPGIQKGLELPFNFDAYREIDITNLNAKSLINAPVLMEIDDTTGYGTDENVPDWNWLMNNKDKVRLFDNDLTTPLNVVFKIASVLDFGLAFTDHVTDGDMDVPGSWTLGGSWVIAGGFASNTAREIALLRQASGIPTSRGGYHIIQLDFTLTGSIDDDGLVIGQNADVAYLLSKRNGVGLRKEYFLMPTTDGDMDISKTIDSSISYVDNVEAWAGPADGVEQNLLNPEITSDTGWTIEGGSSWLFAANYYYNINTSEESYIENDIDTAIIPGEYYLVTLKVYVKSVEINTLYCTLNNSEANGFFIPHTDSNAETIYITRIIKATANAFRIYKSEEEAEVRIYYARCVNIDACMGSNIIEIIPRYPEIEISESRKAYLGWCKQDGKIGVNQAEWRSPSYGEFVNWETDFVNQKTFGNVGVNNVDTIVSAPCQDETLTDVINKADMNTNGELKNMVFDDTINICELPVVGEELPQCSNNLRLTSNLPNDSVRFNFDPTFNLPSSGNYGAGYIYITGTNLSLHSENVLVDIEFYDGTTEHLRLWLNSSGAWKTTCHGSDATFGSITDVDTTKDERYFVCLSWSDDENISLFVYNIEDDTYEFQEKTGSADYARYRNFNMFHLGSNTASHYTLEDMRYTNWVMQMGTYLSAGQVTDQNAVQNLANRMPLLNIGMIGYNWNTSTHNNNVEIGEIKTFDYKKYPEWAGYSKVNGVSFPDKYVKKCHGEIVRGIPTPSYLRGQTQYRNTVIFFYRNGFNVFPLEGLPDTWRDSAENLIPERKRDGLSCADSLVVTPYGIIWLTETGINLWNASAYRKVTEGRMDIPIKDSYKGIYLPIPEQYALHDNSFTSEDVAVSFVDTTELIVLSSGTWDTDIYKVGVQIFVFGADTDTNNQKYIISNVNGGTLTVVGDVGITTSIGVNSITVKTTKTYIYDLPEDKLTTFSGLDILYATALSGGSTEENLNLFLNSYGKLIKYPDYDQKKTSVLAYATKVFQTYYASYQQFNPHISGSAIVDVKATDSQNNNEQEDLDRTLYNMKENFFPIGFFGEKVEIKIKNADEISNVIIAYSPRNTRR